jgi:hypothetical protein
MDLILSDLSLVRINKFCWLMNYYNVNFSSVIKYLK